MEKTQLQLQYNKYNFNPGDTVIFQGKEVVIIEFSPTCINATISISNGKGDITIMTEMLTPKK